MKKSDPPNPNATIQIDLSEVAEILDSAPLESEPSVGRRTAPPPLPPEVVAARVPSVMPGSPHGMVIPPIEAPPSNKRYIVYGLILVGALGLALLVGAVAGPMLRGAPPAASATPSARPIAANPKQPAVISIPMVEVSDDGGSN